MFLLYLHDSIKSLEKLLRGQSEKIHVALLLSKVPSDFHNSILRNSSNNKRKKKRLTELIIEYIENKVKHCLELLRSSEIILLSENKCI